MRLEGGGAPPVSLTKIDDPPDEDTTGDGKIDTKTITFQSSSDWGTSQKIASRLRLHSVFIGLLEYVV